MEKAWFSEIPAIAHKHKTKKSFLINGCNDFLVPKKVQNKIADPTTRIEVSAFGEIKCGAICFTAITLVPKKKLAKMTATTALSLEFDGCRDILFNQ